MSASSNAHSAPSRKRHRPPVVCTECRRRKAACDRKNPCAQCIQYDLACVYQNRQSAPECPAPGLPFGPSASNATNTSSEHSSIPVRASDEAAANVAFPHDQAMSATDLQQSTPLRLNPSASVGGALDNATFSRLGLILTPPVTASSSTLETIDKSIALSQPMPVQPGHSLSEQNDQTSGLKGRYLKSRLFGQSHWMNSCSKFEEVMRANNASLFSASSSITELVEKCKGLASQLKASRPLSTPLDLRNCIPSKELCHQLKQAYFRTFEGVFRILHVPSFERDYDQYWEDPQVASESFVVRLLLVVAIGTCFHTGPTTSGQSLHESSAQWIRAANMYLSGPVEKRRLNLGSVQIYCLLLLALQTNSVGGDLTWITAGSLVRTAMSVGLHRDPVYFPHMTVLQTEMRRRLWYTTVEIAVQASLDSGMPPLISCSDYDWEPPSNIDDSRIDENSSSVPQAESDATFTETSMLRMLARSVPLRIETARILNGLYSDTSYEATIALGEKLTQACRANSTSFQAFNDTGSLDHKRPSAFAIKMVDTLCRRFLLSLHTPFAHKAAIDYTYYYSRKVCLDASLLLLSYATVSPAPSPQAQLDDFTRLRHVGRGMYRSVLLNAAATVCVEVITDLREDSSPWTSVTSNDPRSRALRDVVAVTWQRMQSGETSVKAHVGFVCALAQIEALQAGVSVEEATMDAAFKSLKSCHAVLEARVKEMGNFTEENIHDLRGDLDYGSRFDQGPLTDHFDANLDYSLDDDRWLSSLWLDE